jgi:hypothetical protein
LTADSARRDFTPGATRSSCSDADDAHGVSTLLAVIKAAGFRLALDARKHRAA